MEFNKLYFGGNSGRPSGEKEKKLGGGNDKKGGISETRFVNAYKKFTQEFNPNMPADKVKAKAQRAWDHLIGIKGLTVVEKEPAGSNPRKDEPAGVFLYNKGSRFSGTVQTFAVFDYDLKKYMSRKKKNS